MNNPKSELIKTLELSINYSLKRINNLKKIAFIKAN